MRERLAFEEYPKEKITGIWACYFNNLRGIMSVDGGNDYKQAHNNSRYLDISLKLKPLVLPSILKTIIIIDALIYQMMFDR